MDKARPDTPGGPYTIYEEGFTPGGTALEFWQWFDALPRAERDRMNNAKTAEEFKWLAARAWELWPPKAE